MAPHALVFPFPAQGHLIPMMQLSAALSRFGITVTFVTTEYHLAQLVAAARHQYRPVTWHGAAAEEAMCMWELESDPHVRLAGLPDGLPPGDDRSPTSLVFIDSVDNLGAEFEKLLGRLCNSDGSDNNDLTCIISDSFLPWTQDIAQRWSIPRVFFWTQSLAVCAVYSNISKLPYDPFSTPVMSREQLPMLAEGTIMPGFPAVDPYDLPFSAVTMGDEKGQRWLSAILHEQFSRINEAEWVLANSFDELQLEGSLMSALTTSGAIPRLLTIGPLIDDLVTAPHKRQDTTSMYIADGDGVRLDDDHNDADNQSAGQIRKKFRACLWKEEQEEGLLAWLDAQAPASVVFVSFGSVVTQSEEDIRELGMGLLAARQPFLWAARWGWDKIMNNNNPDQGDYPDKIRNNNADCDNQGHYQEVIKEEVDQGENGGRRILPGEFWKFTLEEGRGKLISWAPQLAVLSHPAIGGFLTHCGWNSTIESLSMGVPLLGLPGFLDQSTNCWFVSSQLKAGVEVKRGKDGKISRTEIERAVRIVMQQQQQHKEEFRGAAARVRDAARRAWQAPHGSSCRNLALFVERMFGIKSR